MDIKDILKPENLRALLVYLSLYMIGRAIFFLVIDEPFAYFSSHRQQDMFQQLFDLDIPMVILTIMWPLILSFLTLLHKDLRIGKGLFISVIVVHTLSCIIAAAMIYLWGYPEVILANEYTLPTVTTVIVVTVVTIVTSAASVVLYQMKYNIFTVIFDKEVDLK